MKKLLLVLLIFLVGCGNDINKFKGEYENKEGIEVNIDKNNIKVDSPLSSLGTHIVKVELHKKVIANVKINLVK